MEAYIEIDGKRVKLTEEQLYALGLEMAKDNPFERIDRRNYYFIDGIGRINSSCEHRQPGDLKHYQIGNYCADEKLMRQRVLHEILNRLLWRYSMEHEENEIEQRDGAKKYYIYWGYISREWRVEYNNMNTKTIGIPYFATKKIAESAIEEIIKPFMAEHPEFEW